MEDDFNLLQDIPTLYMSTITKSVFSERKIDTILHQQNTQTSRRATFSLLSSFKPDLRNGRFDDILHVSTTLMILPLLPENAFVEFHQ